MQNVEITPSSIEELAQFSAAERMAALRAAALSAADVLNGRTILNVNSTPQGGGVAEMLSCLLGYARGAGVDARWSVIEGNPEFFAITKRLHNRLHGSEGDHGDLGPAERAIYERVCEENAEEARALLRPGDVVVLHDPQTAGMIPLLRRFGALVVWRCHVGTDSTNNWRQEAWGFIHAYLEQAHRYIFSVESVIPDWIDRERVEIIPPSIDPLSAKNRPMSLEQAHAILSHVGIVQPNRSAGTPSFERRDGSLSRVDHMADLIMTGPAPSVDSRLIVQVSRWDRLKDPVGVMRGFAETVRDGRQTRLVLAGPVVTGVADDPEGGAVLTEALAEWRSLTHFQRGRIQLVCLPMNDVEENAAIVNALQTSAEVVVQKSLEEGFGLTVTEAMWKSKPVISSAVGGVTSQITTGKDGLLIKDPSDLGEFGGALQSVLDDPEYGRTLGMNARETVQEHFLSDRHLLQYMELFEQLCSVG